MKNPVAIILYGGVAVGKLTTAKVLCNVTDFKLSHNHQILDLVSSVYEKNHPERDKVLLETRYSFYGLIAESKTSIVITQTYSHGYAYTTGITHEEYMQKIESLFVNQGYQVLFVHLLVDNKETLKRVSSPDRQEFDKMVRKQRLKDLHSNNDFLTSPQLVNNLVVDNTRKTPDEVASLITGHLEMDSG